MIPEVLIGAAGGISLGVAAFLLARTAGWDIVDKEKTRRASLVPLLAAAGLFVIGWLYSPVAGAVLATFPWAVAKLANVLRAAARRKRLSEQIPSLLDRLGSTLRAGVGLERALAETAQDSTEPIRSEILHAVQELQMGRPLSEALEGLDKRLALEDGTLAVTAMQLAQETGGNLSEILARISATLRSRQTLQGRLRALTAQGKMQAVVVGLLPILLGLFLWMLDPESIRSFVGSAAGQKLLAASALLEGIGVLWILRITRLDV